MRVKWPSVTLVVECTLNPDLWADQSADPDLHREEQVVEQSGDQLLKSLQEWEEMLFGSLKWNVDSRWAVWGCFAVGTEQACILVLILWDFRVQRWQYFVNLLRSMKSFSRKIKELFHKTQQSLFHSWLYIQFAVYTESASHSLWPFLKNVFSHANSMSVSLLVSPSATLVSTEISIK